MNFKKLVGEKVYLSPISADSIELFTKWMNDFGVTDYTARSQFVFSYEAEKAWFDNKVKSKDYMLSIVTLKDDEVVGNIELQSIDSVNREATLGILIGEEKNRNKGYGTEAISLLLDYGFNYLNLNNISLTVLACNDRAKRCYEKVGLKEFGRKRKCKFVNGKYYDLIYMDILSEEFKEEYIKNKNVK